MNLSKIILNKKAFTLIEVMISSALLIIIFTSFMTFVLNMQRQIINQDKNLALKSVIQNFIQGISSNPSEYQRYYSCIKKTISSSKPATDIGCVTEASLLTYDKLAFVLTSDGSLVPKDECPSCKNRFGYLLYPSSVESFSTLVIKAASSETKIIYQARSYVGE